MNRKSLTIGFILLITSLCSGCWDVEEINHRAIVIALGLDLTPAGMIKMSAQIPVVSDLASGGSGGGRAAAPPKPFHVVSSEAETSYGTVGNLQSKTGNSLFLGQLKTTIISTDLAERGLKPYVNFLERHPEMSSTSVVVLTKGSAAEILGTPLNSKEIPGLSILNFLRSSSKADLAYSLREWQIVRATAVGPGDVYLPMISISQPEQAYIINGLGVFHHDRMVGELSDNETRMFGFLTGKAKNAYPSVYINNQIGTATFRNVTVDSKTKAIAKGDQIEFVIKSRARGFLVELTSSKSPLDVKDVKLIQTKTEQAIKGEMVKTVRHLQNLNSDILGFGELVRATLPNTWQRINWDQEYPRVKVSIDFKFNVEKTGTHR